MIYTAATYQWDVLNERVKSKLSLSETQKAFCFKNISHALFETTQSLAQFYPHKKKVVFIKGNSPSIPFVLPRFYKLGFSVMVITLEEGQDLEILKTKIPEDALFVVYAIDHAVTAELNPYFQVLDQYLNEKKIYSLQISHHQHHFNPINLSPFSGLILGYGLNLSVALTGDRLKLLNLLASEFSWDSFDAENPDFFQRPVLWPSTSIDSTKIVKFESELSSIASSFFKDLQTPRLYDRAAIVLKEISGDAFFHQLAIELKVPPESLRASVSTTHTCFWPQMKSWKSWWAPLPEEDVLGRLVLIQYQLTQEPHFLEKCLKAHESVLKLAQW